MLLKKAVIFLCISIGFLVSTAHAAKFADEATMNKIFDELLFDMGGGDDEAKNPIGYHMNNIFMKHLVQYAGQNLSADELAAVYDKGVRELIDHLLVNSQPTNSDKLIKLHVTAMCGKVIFDSLSGGLNEEEAEAISVIIDSILNK